MEAVQLLCDRYRRQPFADAFGPRQDEARGQRLAPDGLREQAYEAAMTDNIPKSHTFANRITTVPWPLPKAHAAR